jgi:ADP-ribosyl-[dinitrogen reductase] hydrolase
MKVVLPQGTNNNKRNILLSYIIPTKHRPLYYPTNNNYSSSSSKLRNQTSIRQRIVQYINRYWILVCVISFLLLVSSSFVLNPTRQAHSNSNIGVLSYMKFLSFISNRTNRSGSTSSTSSKVITAMDGTTPIATAAATTPLTPHEQQQQYILNKVVTAALWSFFAGDAISSPTHWFYGGQQQIQSYYGKNGVTTYIQPSYNLASSILNKSNLSGGGRSTMLSSTSNNQKTIIGHYINHGKQDLWDPSKSIHYHATLHAGENTLEASIARVLMQSISSNHGQFNSTHFRNAYITFMTTPNSHNDTYASTCHRMFFANYYYNKLDPIDCPDNDQHNVDTIDGLVLPTITALAVAGQLHGTIEQASQQAAETVTVTRNSVRLQQYAKAWGAFVFQTIRASAAAIATAANDDNNMNDNNDNMSHTDITNVITKYANEMAQSLDLRVPTIRTNDEITACYLDSAVPAMLDTMIKYIPNNNNNNAPQKQQRYNTRRTSISVWDAILVNANIGGENVHRGSCLGSIWGAIAIANAATASKSTTTTTTAIDLNDIRTIVSPQLINGLYHNKELNDEIQAFINALNQNNVVHAVL